MNEKTIVRVRDVMTDRFELVDGMVMVSDALAIMKKTGSHVLIIDKRSEDDEYGIVLLTDIASKVLAVDRAADRVNVYEIMSKPVVAVDPEMDIRYCARLFSSLGFTYAPVIHNAELKGIVGYADMLLNNIP